MLRSCFNLVIAPKERAYAPRCLRRRSWVEEYRLIGMAIKFAGICGKEIRIHGRNRETVDQSATTQ